MSLLALKALDYSADRIPDRFFEKIPGGLFSSSKRKELGADTRSKGERRKGRGDKRRFQRERSPRTDYSDYSGYDDTDHEREYRDRQRRRRAKSLGENPSRELNASRGRNRERSSESFDGNVDMEPLNRAPQFPPPPTAEYRPYNPADYAPPMGNDYHDRRTSSARPDYGYAPQPAAPPSTAQARYTPAGYAPSPPTAAPPPPNPEYAYNPAQYAPLNQELYSPAQAAGQYRAPGNAYPSPPPLYRHQSRSQPALDQYPHTADNQLARLESPGRHGSSSSSRRHRHGDGKRHRARSAGPRGRSLSRVTDKFRGRFEDLDLHDKNLAASVGGALAGGLAGRAVGKGTLSTLVGAAIGGFGGSEIEKRKERRKSARGTSKSRDRRRSRSSRRKDDYSRSPSRDRRRDDYSDRYDSYSDSDSDGHRSSARRRRSSRRPKRNSDDRPDRF